LGSGCGQLPDLAPTTRRGGGKEKGDHGPLLLLWAQRKGTKIDILPGKGGKGKKYEGVKRGDITTTGEKKKKKEPEKRTSNWNSKSRAKKPERNTHKGSLG